MWNLSHFTQGKGWKVALTSNEQDNCLTQDYKAVVIVKLLYNLIQVQYVGTHINITKLNTAWDILWLNSCSQTDFLVQKGLILHCNGA